MRHASRALFSGLLGLALYSFVLAAFAATKPKVGPPAPTPQVSAAPAAAATHDRHGYPIYPGTCFCWNL